MDPSGLRVTRNAYFSLLTHTKKLLLVTFCDLTAKTGVSFWTHGTDGTDGMDGTDGTDGQTYVMVEMVILLQV